MKILLTLSLLVFLFEASSGQKQNNFWFFGRNAGLDFNSPSPISIEGELVSFFNTASVSEPNGNLLFYSNGMTVWDRNHNVMPNGVGLTAGLYSFQPALIVPYPNSQNKYFLFTTEESSSGGGLSYSLIDMSLNSGYGDIVPGTKNTLLMDETAPKITAILHPNNSDIWVITHKLNSQEFLAFLITSSGLNTVPVISSVGSIIELGSNGGPLKGSHNGTKIVHVSTYSDLLEIFDFDSNTGIISNFNDLAHLLNTDETTYSSEFSPNDSLLYISTFQEGNFVNRLYQIRLQSLEVTNLNNPLKANPGSLQLGPDNKIYLSRGGEEALSTIHQPNNEGLACEFEFSGVSLQPGTFSYAGFPSKVPYSFPLDSNRIPSLGKDTSLCIGDSLVLNFNFPTNCDSLEITWSNGSTASEIVVHQPGRYWVQVHSNCFIFTDSINIYFEVCTPIVYYTLESCLSFMHNGSHMDYSEFNPSYPNSLSCGEVSATNVYRIIPQKHSCTQGVDSLVAMCISSSDSCAFITGDPATLIFTVTIKPYADSMTHLAGLEFYEKSPFEYSWINGSSGPNNYPQMFGIRILENGVEIYKANNIETKNYWNLRSFTFFNIDEFNIYDSSVFTIELLPYCPVGNGSAESVWDVDEIKIFGSCGFLQKDIKVLKGIIETKEHNAVSGVEMQLSKMPSFNEFESRVSNEDGSFLFNNLIKNDEYILKGFKNDDILNGVSTLDLLLIQKHLLGLISFPTLHSHIAADINNNGKVTAIDLLELRKVLLRINSEFPNNTSWRFGPLSQKLIGTNISSFEEICYIKPSNQDTQVIDLVGIKIGDINGDAKLQYNQSDIGFRSNNSVEVIIDLQEPRNSQDVTINFIIQEDLNIIGAQFALNIEGLELISLNESKLIISPYHYSIVDNIVRLSWNSNETVNLSSGDTLFSMVLKRSSKTGPKISHPSYDLNPEIYLENLEIYNVDFTFNKILSDVNKSEISFLELNFINDELAIGFHQKKAGKTDLRFYNLCGQLVAKIIKNYSIGQQLEYVNFKNIPAGIVFCQVLNKETNIVKSFIKAE